MNGLVIMTKYRIYKLKHKILEILYNKYSLQNGNINFENISLKLNQIVSQLNEKEELIFNILNSLSDNEFKEVINNEEGKNSLFSINSNGIESYIEKKYTIKIKKEILNDIYDYGKTILVILTIFISTYTFTFNTIQKQKINELEQRIKKIEEKLLTLKVSNE